MSSCNIPSAWLFQIPLPTRTIHQNRNYLADDRSQYLKPGIMGRRDNTSTNNQSYIPGTGLLTIMEPRVKSEICWSVPKRKGEEKKGEEGKVGEGRGL